MRTDMAIERFAEVPEAERGGITVDRTGGDGWTMTKITVKTKTAGQRLQKPVGTYFTLETDAFPDVTSLTGEKTQALAKALSSLLPKTGPVLVAGLGNRNVTPDALGPRCASHVLATAHLGGDAIKALSLPDLRPVAVIAPGVSGQTGLEASAVVKGVCGSLKPAAVIAVDALASGSVTRLGNNVQLSSAGIEPGAGVGNARKALSYETLGVPVVSVGVPTVVDAVTIAGELGGGAAEGAGRNSGACDSLMVTPRDIDAVIEGAARFVALALNLALQPNLSAEEIMGVT